MSDFMRKISAEILILSISISSSGSGFTGKVKLNIIINFNLSSSKLASISVAELVSKLIFMELDLLVNRTQVKKQLIFDY